MSKIVSLSYLNDYNSQELENAIKNTLTQLCISIKPKTKVLIKACLPSAVSADMAETTHPSVVRALANWLKDLGAECIVADSPYKKYTPENLERVYLNTGMLDAANQTNCILNKDLSTFKIETPNGVATKSLTLLNIINKVDVIINVGKVKIDEQFGYFGAVANLFGLVPGDIKSQVLSRMEKQKDFHNFVLDIYDQINEKVVLNVLDGVVALESENTPRMLNCLAIAEDMFNLDAAMIDILGINPYNTLLNQAEARGFYSASKNYKIINDKLERFKLEDFKLHDFHETSPLHKDKKEQAKYFKHNHSRTKIEPNRCKGCSICSKICPTGAITMKTDKRGELYASIDYKKCIFCNKCHTACPYSVVQVVEPSGYKRIMHEIEKQNPKDA